MTKPIYPECRIYESKNWVSIFSDNALSPIRRQTIIQTNARWLLIELLGTNFSEFLIKMQNFLSLKFIRKYRLGNGGQFV